MLEVRYRSGKKPEKTFRTLDKLKWPLPVIVSLDWNGEDRRDDECPETWWRKKCVRLLEATARHH